MTKKPRACWSAFCARLLPRGPEMMKRYALPGLISALAASFLLAACGGEGTPKAPPGPGAGGPPGAMPPPEVEVAQVARGSAVLTRELPGRLQAVRTAQVRARVEGIVEKRLFAEGSEVQAGQTLFKLDDRTFRASALAAEADVAAARLTVERYRPLLEIKAVSQQEMDLAEARLKQAEAALARARLDLENTTVPASIPGRIGRTLVTEGALVSKDDATHLATIEQIDPIQVLFTQSNADLLRLKAAVASGKFRAAQTSRAELILDDGSVYPQAGRLIFSDLAVDPNTGAIQMKAEFPNPQRELLPGTFVRVRLPAAAADNVVRLPQRAVQNGPQGQFVLLVDAESKVVPRPVKTEGMAGGDFIIGAGLAGGERVIINGVQRSRPGTTVKPVPWNPQTPLLPPAPGAPAAPAKGHCHAGALLPR